MKIKTRKGLFETNSSSEHTITIMKSELYDKWVCGEIAVRLYSTDDSECDSCWGNFWSTQDFFDICESGEAIEKNKVLIAEIIENEKTGLDNFIRDMESMPEEHRIEMEKSYGCTVDKLCDNYSKMTYNKIKEWESYPDKVTNTAKLGNELYITYSEYEDALRHGGCKSPFVHRTDDMTIFGRMEF